MTDITELALLVSKAKASVFTLEYISQFEPADIDSDDVDLRFEVDGRDTGTNVSIVDECGQAAKVIGALVEALESEQRICSTWRKTAEANSEKLEKAQAKNALVAGGIEAAAKLHERIAELESRTVTVEPFRSFVTDADLAALHRFAECCDDPESGGHDLEKEQVRRLEEIGALRRSGRVHWITGFGDVLISITSGIKWEAD